MFRFYNGLSPSLMNNIFNLKEVTPYNLRHVPDLRVYITELQEFHTKYMGCTARKTKEHGKPRAF